MRNCLPFAVQAAVPWVLAPWWLLSVPSRLPWIDTPRGRGLAGCSQSLTTASLPNVITGTGTWHYLQRLPPECARPWQQWFTPQDSGLAALTRHGVNARQVILRGFGRRLNKKVVNVAPSPVFARLETAHDRVAGAVKMFRCVPALRLIAAANMAARTAHSQVHPSGAHLQAFLATLGCSWIDISHLIEMRALCVRHPHP